MYHHIVYKITNTINNIIYIGVHSTKNIDDNYMGSGAALVRAQKEFGINNFNKHILHILESRSAVLEMEAKIVNKKFVDSPNTYNKVLGGGAGGVIGLASVRDSNGNTLSVDINDIRFTSGELVGVQKGKITVKDKDGNNYSVCRNDPKYLSGELVHNTKGFTTVRDKDGKTFSVNIKDPRITTGELVGIAKGKITVKDKDGNTLSVYKNDPRYISGELVGNKKGYKWIHHSKNKLKKSVAPEDIDRHLAEGWKIGRKLT